MTKNAYEHAVDYACASIKTLYLMNGGALLAIMAFLGNASQFKPLIPMIAEWSIAFIVGLVFAVLANVMGYTAHAAHTRSNDNIYNSHQRYGFLFAALSLFAFVVGAMGYIFTLSCYAVPK